MKRTSITVGITRTQSLGNYSNVRPTITQTVELDEGDDEEAIRSQLKAEAQDFVEALIDEALEADGQRARFSNEPRFQIIVTTERYVGDWSNRQKLSPPEQLIVILPNARRTIVDGSSWFQHLPTGPARGVRLGHAISLAVDFMAENPGYQLITCDDDDLARLPPWIFDPVPEPERPAAPTRDGDDWDGREENDELDDEEDTDDEE